MHTTRTLWSTLIKNKIHLILEFLWVVLNLLKNRAKQYEKILKTFILNRRYLYKCRLFQALYSLIENLPSVSVFCRWSSKLSGCQSLDLKIEKIEKSFFNYLVRSHYKRIHFISYTFFIHHHVQYWRVTNY